MLSSLMMAFSTNIFMIFLGLLGLRFAGQGLLSHISSTTISKFFDKMRGKALSITSLGYSTGEGFFPILMSFVIGYVGWRNSLILNSLIVAVILIPFLWFALSKVKNLNSETDNSVKNSNTSRSILFQDRNFYLIALNSIVLPFLVTGLFFYQSSLAEFKNWTIEWISFSFLGFAAGRTISSLLSGQLIDKFSALKLLPLYLLPFLIGLLSLLYFDHIYIAIAYLTLTGISVGFGSTIKTAVIAEIYGVKSLGGIRSVFATIMILGTALSPLLFGFLLDNGYSFLHIISGGIILVISVSLLSTQVAAKYKYAIESNS